MSRTHNLFHRKRMTMALLAGGLTLLASAGALAQPGWGGGPYGGAGRGPAPFATIDSNGDGSISAEEHAAFRAERMAANAQAGRLLRNAGQAPQFADLDADGDGRLSQAEVAQFRNERMAARGWQRGGRGGPGSGRCGGPGYRGW